MRDFMMAAVPLVVAGIALAVFFAGRAEKKKKREKENGYEAMGMGLVTAAVVVKNRKKKKGRVFRTVFLCIFITVLLLAEVFTYFGGFGTGESVDPEEFAKYAEPVQSLTIPEGVRVVALGEASHGNSEFQQLKRDVRW